MNKQPLDKAKALARLEDLCVRAEHCTGELRQKLYQWGISGKEAEEIMASLIKDKFVDDVRFCEAFVRDKVRFGRWGRRKIAMALAAKRVDRDIIADACANIDAEDYRRALRAVISAKVRQLGGESALSDYALRQKVYAYALQRGFTSSEVAGALRAFRGA